MPGGQSIDRPFYKVQWSCSRTVNIQSNGSTNTSDSGRETDQRPNFFDCLLYHPE
jgi:hypothetical protein